MAPASRPSVYVKKARATRQRILVEATKLFARQGYHKTTVSDLASAIGMTQGALFHHFPNKEALLDAVVERLARGMDSYRAQLAEGGSADTVRKIVNLMVDHFNRQPEATICLAVLAAEFAGTDAPILEKIRRVYDRFVDPFAAVLSTHPTIRDPRAAAIAFIGAVQGIAIQGLLREGKPPLAELAPAFLAMMNMPRKW